MKLYEIPAGAKFTVPELNNQEIYKFFDLHHMTSHCEDRNGTLVKLPAWTEVEIITGE